MNILIRFHQDCVIIVASREFAHLRGDDWAKNVTSRVKLHPPGSHVIQLTRTIFKRKSHIKETKKNAPPTGGHVFSPIWTIFKLVQDINKTNVLTNFHDNWAKIVTSRVLTSHVIQLTGTIFKLKSHIKETNVLTKFHENWAKNVTSRVFTCFHYIYRERKMPPPPGRHVFSPIWTIFKLVRDINKGQNFHKTSIRQSNNQFFPSENLVYKTNVLTNFHDDWAKIVTCRDHVIRLTGTIFELNSHIKETNVLTKFHENWAKYVTSRVFTCFHYIHIEKNAPPTDGHVFSPIWTIFQLVRDINKTNVLTNFHNDWAKNVTSRVVTSHVIRLTGTIFKLKSHIKETEVLIKFHENWAKNVTSRKNAPPTGGHVFSPIWTIFKLVRDINKTNVLTIFHDDWAKIVTSRVFTRKTALPTGGPDVTSPVFTSFELDRDFIGTKLLTKFLVDRTINVASRVFTNKC
ncbi:hypothetical protein DPMN_136670 [Dreissena polymorpha]|uniref:Uncharacterized protein n=1 Tax=Dreissena polymorpha TaxID=45954 RepID=A0A9D4G1A5_DREPO|nr:hypothetical protein DPMN_136670 [Dreissena polymorpha]